jgi:hypothetical protein
METWAHGLDVRAALGVEAVDTDRLAHVAWLATRALPYAYSWPAASRRRALRVELTLPSGACGHGPADAPNRITGFGRRVLPGVRASLRRLPIPPLVIEGTPPGAALAVARAFL